MVTLNQKQVKTQCWRVLMPKTSLYLHFCVLAKTFATSACKKCFVQSDSNFSDN